MCLRSQIGNDHARARRRVQRTRIDAAAQAPSDADRRGGAAESWWTVSRVDREAGPYHGPPICCQDSRRQDPIGSARGTCASVPRGEPARRCAARRRGPTASSVTEATWSTTAATSAGRRRSIQERLGTNPSRLAACRAPARVREWRRGRDRRACRPRAAARRAQRRRSLHRRAPPPPARGSSAGCR